MSQNPFDMFFKDLDHYDGYFFLDKAGKIVGCYDGDKNSGYIWNAPFGSKEAIIGYFDGYFIYKGIGKDGQIVAAFDGNKKFGYIWDVSNGAKKDIVGQFDGYYIEDYRNRSKGKSDGCFLTTACTSTKNLPDNCMELTLLRSFRDNYLLKSEEGKLDVKTYYQIAPQIVSQINKEDKCVDIYSDIYHGLVSQSLTLLNQGKRIAAFDNYQKRTLELEKEFSGENSNSNKSKIIVAKKRLHKASPLNKPSIELL